MHPSGPHVVPPPHTLPQARQLLESESGSTQAVPQAMRVPTQVHAPLTHCAPAWQVRPHMPQLFRSVAKVVQVPPQSTVPVAQELEHAPALQTWPARQTEPSLAPAQSALAPQNDRSVRGSMQRVPHFTVPEGQESAQRPPVQT